VVIARFCNELGIQLLGR